MKNNDARIILDRIFEDFPSVHTADIPGIDLYMDQVTTFLQEKLRGISRDPDGDKFLTKTMINNYVKNKVLIPPVKKKYSRDHMMLLIIIYYMKSFLSISDIGAITAPMMERYTDAYFPDHKKDQSDKKNDRRDNKKKSTGDTYADKGGQEEKQLQFRDIYERIVDNLEESIPGIHRDLSGQIERSENDFSDVPEEDRPMLQRFSLICRLSAEVYIRKLLIEKLLDNDII